MMNGTTIAEFEGGTWGAQPFTTSGRRYTGPAAGEGARTVTVGAGRRRGHLGTVEAATSEGWTNTAILRIEA